jgi:Domain of unknown function (DUF222)
MRRQQEDVLGPMVVILLTDNWCVSRSSCVGIFRPASRVVSGYSSTCPGRNPLSTESTADLLLHRRNVGGCAQDVGMEGLPDSYGSLAMLVREATSKVDLERWADDELLMATVALEAVGRLIDAARVAHAAEIAHRSRVDRGTDRLSARKGCANANELLQRVTRVSTAERRIRLGAETRQNRSIVGAEFPARFDGVARALGGGDIGMDAAWAIVTSLTPKMPRASIAGLRAAESELVSAARSATAADIRAQALIWQVVLDPDGIEPNDDRAMARRGLRLGRERSGLVPISGALMPEIAAKLSTAIDSRLNDADLLDP